MAQQMCTQCGRLVAPGRAEFVDRETGRISNGRSGVFFLFCCTAIATGLASVPLLDALLWHYASNGISARVLVALFGLSMVVLFFLMLLVRSIGRDWNAQLVEQLQYECHGCRQRWSWRVDQPIGPDCAVAPRTRAEEQACTSTIVGWYLEDVVQRRDVRSKL
jgi:hypothetical protein